MDGNGWVMIHRKMADDAKIRQLTPSHRWVFVCYIMLAQREGRWRGYLVDEGSNNYTVRYKGAFCDVEYSGISRCDKRLLELGLLEKTDGGRLKIHNYDKYQKRPVVANPVAQMQQDPATVAIPVAECVADPVRELQQELQQTRSTSSDPNNKEKKKGPSVPKKEPSSADAPEGCGWCLRPCADTSGVRYLMQEMHNRYRIAFGECPTLQPGRDGARLKALRNGGKNDAVILQVYDKYLESPDEWYGKHGYDIPTFVSQYDGIRRSRTSGRQKSTVDYCLEIIAEEEAKGVTRK